MSPPSSNDRAVRLTRWLLLAPPCLPGALMLLLGWLRGSFLPAGDVAAILHARQQADQLLVAGSAALLGGLLMAAWILWKILRPSPPDEEAEADVS